MQTKILSKYLQNSLWELENYFDITVDKWFIYLPNLCSHFSKVSFIVLGLLKWAPTGQNVKCSQKILSTCHSVHHKSHIDTPGVEPELSWWEASACLSYDMSLPEFKN